MAQRPQPVQQPRLDVRGAVDLSALAHPTPPPGSPTGLSAPSGWAIDVDTATFNQLVQASTQFPVVCVLWAPWSQASRQLAEALTTLAAASGGRWLLARIDSEANPQIAQAFQAPTVPVVVAVIGGRPLPLFEGAPPADQLREVIDQVLAAAAASGVSGRAPALPADDAAPEPEEPPLPPLHQRAYDAIEADDLPAAVAAYEQALKENPRDDVARAGLAQVQLMVRTADVDPRTVRAAAAADPADVDAALAVADLDVLGGHVEDAFARLVELVGRVFGDDRERVRRHLLGLFEVVGTDDPRVATARRTLASALY